MLSVWSQSPLPTTTPSPEDAPSPLSSSLLLGAQILANVFLYLCAIVVGIMSYYMADRKHRKAFLEARQSLEVKMNLEEQSQQQVRLLGGLRAVGWELVPRRWEEGPVGGGWEGSPVRSPVGLEFPHQVRCSPPDATSGVPRLEGLLPTSGSFSYWKLTPESSVLGLNLPLSLFQLIFVCVSLYLKLFKEMHHPSSRQWLPVFLSQVNERCTLNACAPWAC